MVKAPFVWSWSRYQTWDECRRRYWFVYYGARAGGRAGAQPRARELYVLKRLQTVPQWLGLAAHRAAEAVLKRVKEGGSARLDEARAAAMQQAGAELDAAIAGLHRIEPRAHAGLVELELPDAGTLFDRSAALGELDLLLEATLQHPLLTRLLAVPSRIVEVEELRRVWLGEVAAWVSLDVLVRDGRGGLVVIDWKSGRHHDEAEVGRQLAVYGAYVHRRYGQPIEQVVGLHAQVRAGTFTTHRLDQATLDQAVADVQRSARAMWEALPSPARDVAPEDRFPTLPEGAAACGTCRFRGVCGR